VPFGHCNPARPLPQGRRDGGEGQDLNAENNDARLWAATVKWRRETGFLTEAFASLRAGLIKEETLGGLALRAHSIGPNDPVPAGRKGGLSTGDTDFMPQCLSGKVCGQTTDTNVAAPFLVVRSSSVKSVVNAISWSVWKAV
jgi:hypothetical protein